MNKQQMIKKILLTLVSVLLMGTSVSLLKIVDMGMDSYTYMNVSISEKIGWTLGHWQMLLNCLMFIPVLIWGRKQLGIGTLFNMILVGYTADFCGWIWGKLNLEGILTVPFIRLMIMLISLVVFIFAAATYMSTDLGTSPFDALPMMISEKLPKIPFKIIRFVWDSLAVVVGFIFSGEVKIVTILMVLFLGQTITFVRSKLNYNGRAFSK